MLEEERIKMPCQWLGCFDFVRATQVVQVAGYTPFVCDEHAESARAVGYRLLPVAEPKASSR